jgi:hypothetical protein
LSGLLVLAGVAALAGIGNILVGAAFRDAGPRGAARGALAWVVGAGAGSFLLFLLLWAGMGLGLASRIVVGLGLAALASSFAISRRGEEAPRERPGLVARLLVAASVAAIVVAAFEAVAVPLAAWDSWVNWASKARLLFAEGFLTRALHADPARLATNLDYPLLLPVLEAFFWELRGSVDERLATLVPVSFHAALLVLLYAAVRRFASAAVAAGAVAFVAWTPLCGAFAPMGFADPVVAGLVVAALLAASLANESPRAAAFAGLLAGLLPWAKNEGLVWLVLVAGFVGVTLSKGQTGRARRAAAFAVPALLPVALWQLFLLFGGTVRYVFLAPTPANFVAGLARLPVLVVIVTKHLAGPGWSFVFPATLAVLIVRRRTALRGADPGLLVLPIAFLAAVSASFLLSRFDPWLPHVVNSIDRLALQAFPVVVWWLAAQGVDAGVLPGAVTATSDSRP